MAILFFCLDASASSAQVPNERDQGQASVSAPLLHQKRKESAKKLFLNRSYFFLNEKVAKNQGCIKFAGKSTQHQSDSRNSSRRKGRDSNSLESTHQHSSRPGR